MKLSWSFIASSLYCTATTAVRPSVSPETARLIIAQRLGLSRFHSVEHSDAESIRHINAFGGHTHKLFASHSSSNLENERSGAHLLVWVEGMEDRDATVIVSDVSREVASFTIENPPATTENDRLIQDIIVQANSLPSDSEDSRRISVHKTLEQIHEFDTAFEPSLRPEVYNGFLSILRVQVDQKSEHPFERVAMIIDSMDGMKLLDGSSYTIVYMPASAGHNKRAVNAWGNYGMPASDARRQNPEAFLSSGPEPASSPAPPISDLEDFPVSVNQAKAKAPVRGILPSCFNTLSSCQKTTNNCTGHGECKLLHKGRGSGSSQQTVDCYGCACAPTIVRVGEDQGKDSARKVTYWGGPACQKKDISVQFWLFVGSGIILAFLVSAGIGMLYSMGSEELPSVIGAGVSGPVRK